MKHYTFQKPKNIIMLRCFGFVEISLIFFYMSDLTSTENVRQEFFFTCCRTLSDCQLTLFYGVNHLLTIHFPKLGSHDSFVIYTTFSTIFLFFVVRWSEFQVRFGGRVRI